MPDAPPAGSSSNRPPTPSDAPPLTPADRAIVEAAACADLAASGYKQPWDDMPSYIQDEWRRSARAALAAAVEAAARGD